MKNYYLYKLDKSCHCINLIVSLIIFTLLLLLSTSSAYAQSMPFPKADKNGDFVIRGYPYWEVVDTDPAGLNGRLSMDHSYEWFSPGCEYRKRNIYEWPVVRRFKKGTLLLADLSPAGFCTSFDDRGKPWIRVSIDSEFGGIICYVRANEKYIKPVKKPAYTKKLTYKLATWKTFSSGCKIFSKPDSWSAELQCKTAIDDTFIILSEKGDWFRIFTRGNKQGYVLKKNLDVEKDNILGAALTIKKTGLRKYPIGRYPVFKSVEPGKVVFLISAKKGEVDFSGLYNEIDDTAPWIRIMTDKYFYGFVDPGNLEWIPLD